jgi:hypothetical protein
MRLTRRIWQQGGLFYFEPADDHGEGFWVDHLGRLGVDQDDGSVIWHEVHDGRVYAKDRANPDDSMIELEHTRIHGVMGSPNLPSNMTKIGAALVLFVTLFLGACGRPPLESCDTDPVTNRPKVGTCVSPTHEASALELEPWPGDPSRTVCTWVGAADRFPVVGCNPEPGVSCVAGPIPVLTFGTCFPEPLAAPATFGYQVCDDGVSALCHYNGGGRNASIFPVGGCEPEDGITCVTACPGVQQ